MHPRRAHKPVHRPLHKNCIFLVLLALTGVFMTSSMLLGSHLDPSQDDDVSLSTEHKSHPESPSQLLHTKSGKISTELHYNNGEPQSRPIHRFQHHQEAAKQRRLQQGLTTPREKWEREKWDPNDWERIQNNVQALREPEIPIPSDLPYDVYSCPFDPPPHYPYAWNVMAVLENWNPETTDLPSLIHQGICVFDWDNEGDDQKAESYRQKEVPFIVANYPEVLRTTERWATRGYLEELIGERTEPNDHSHSNHFMYWKTKAPLADFDPPTDTVKLTYAQWLEKANRLQNVRKPTKEEHWYFRLNAMLQNHAYLYEELPFFDPSKGKALTMIEPNEHRGINCRFGMKGTIAESHYDSHSNFIVIMGGQRRYILAHPDQCNNMELYPEGHPSARHSRVNWSTAYDHWQDSDRPFVSTMVNEVLLQAGDMLYLPTHWFHFIVSISTSYQCNSRSGASNVYQPHIDKCGFGKEKTSH